MGKRRDSSYYSKLGEFLDVIQREDFLHFDVLVYELRDKDPDLYQFLVEEGSSDTIFLLRTVVDSRRRRLDWERAAAQEQKSH